MGSGYRHRLSVRWLPSVAVLLLPKRTMFSESMGIKSKLLCSACKPYHKLVLSSLISCPFPATFPPYWNAVPAHPHSHPWALHSSMLSVQFYLPRVFYAPSPSDPPKPPSLNVTSSVKPSDRVRSPECSLSALLISLLYI